MSIVMPVRNGAATLPDQLDALVRARPPAVAFEVVVADNGSTDATVQVVDQYAERLPLRVADASASPGINAARNTGVRASTGRWILLCDADDEVDEGWLMAMGAAFEFGAQLVGGPIDYRRLNPAEVRRWRGADKGRVEMMHGFLPSPHGANCGFTRDVFDEIGGFDPAYRYGGEETEFFWRAQLAGHELVVVDAAVVHYALRSDLSGLWRQFRSYGASQAQLYADFRAAGMPGRSVGDLVRTVWWIVSRAPFAATRGRRGAWVRVLAQQWGRICGSISLRTRFL